MNPTSIMTQSDMKTFSMPIGGVAKVLSYLNPPLGAGVQPSVTN